MSHTDPLQSAALWDCVMRDRVLVPDHRFCPFCIRVAGLGACACCAMQSWVRKLLLGQELGITATEVCR